MGRAPRARTDESGQIVLGWLAKVVFGLVIAGLVLFEIVGVLLARGTAADTASKAAQEAGFTFRDTGSIEAAEDTARLEVAKEGAEFLAIEVDAQERTTTVTVRKKAKTIWIHNIDFFKKYIVATARESAPLPT